MNSLKLTERFESALVYATRLHANQTRKISGVRLKPPILIVEIKKNFPYLKPLTSGMGYSDS